MCLLRSRDPPSALPYALRKGGPGLSDTVVDRIITNLGVFDVVEGGLKLVELAEGVTEAEVREATEATLVEGPF